MPNYIDYDYATNMVKATVGYLAESAVLIIPEPGTLLVVFSGVVMLILRRRAS